MKYVLLAIGLSLCGCDVTYNRDKTAIVVTPRDAESSGTFDGDSVENTIHNHYGVMQNLNKMGWLSPDAEYPDPI
jgi:hypothetical protein